MEIKWIEDFLALTRYQSFSRAAEARNVSQSGFSRRIQSLEQWVGSTLILRNTSPPALTAAGRLLLETAEDVLDKLSYTRAAIRASQSEPTTFFRIAVCHTIAVHFFPLWFDSLLPPYSQVGTQIITANARDSLAKLANGDCEFALVYYRNEIPHPLDSTRYEQARIGVDTLVLLSKPDSCSNPMFSLSRMRNHPFRILTYANKSYFGRCLTHLLERVPMSARDRSPIESDTVEVLKKLTLAGEGAAWLPRSAVESELTNGNLVRAGDESWDLHFEIRAYRDASDMNTLSDALWRQLRG